MILTSGAGASAIGIMMVYATMISAYPFSVGGKNGIDALYVTLSIKRGTVVFGRYLFALALNFCTGMFAYIFTFAALTLTQKGFNAVESLLAVGVSFIIFSIIQAVQIPFYFKLGYEKAKFFAYLPLVAFPLVVFMMSSLFKDILSLEQITSVIEWITANAVVSALAGICVWLIIIVMSIRVSFAWYRKRDF
jgi:hypothetical protein